MIQEIIETESGMIDLDNEGDGIGVEVQEIKVKNREIIAGIIVFMMWEFWF